jgi:hypothetical protein
VRTVSVIVAFTNGHVPWLQATPERCGLVA